MILSFKINRYNKTNILIKEVIKLKTNGLVIAIGNDHTAYEFKQPIIKYLQTEGYQVLDLGTNTSDVVDYPNFGFDVAAAIVSKKADFGIVICGTGIGISIAANRINGVRCALCYEEETVRLARLHNNANVLALGARIIASCKAVELVKLFLETKTSIDKRHQLRVEKLK